MGTTMLDVQTLLQDAARYADRALNAEVNGSDARQRFALTAQVYATIAALVQTVHQQHPAAGECIYLVTASAGSGQAEILAAFQSAADAEDWTHEWNTRPSRHGQALIEVVSVTKAGWAPPDIH